MPVKTNIYKVSKVEHEFGLTKVRPKFPKMPELYLELLANKKKINTALAAEKYIHYYEPIVSSEDSFTGFKPIPRITSVSKENFENTDVHNNQNVQPQLNRKNTFMWESSASMEPSPIVKRKINRPVSSSPQVNSISSTRYKKIKKSIVSSYYKTAKNDYSSSKERRVDDLATADDQRSSHRQLPSGKLATNEVYSGPSVLRSGEAAKYKTQPISHNDNNQQPPPIKEIKKTFGEDKPNFYNIENYETIKDEDDQKRELLFKFHRLKKTYPKVNLPDFNMMSNHDNMKRTYDSTVKNLVIDSTVETYKSYLMMGFMGCEIVLGKIGFDMEGYTQQQTLYMNKYEKLLIELGEKSYVPSSINKWPVEIRLMALVLFQTTIFIVAKIIAKKTNVNLLQMYNSVNGAYETQQKHKEQLNTSSSGFVSGGSSPLTFIPKTKRTTSTNSDGGNRMRGPSV
jgi:hypothetical protein